MSRIIFYSGTAPIGGHLRSALTIAQELISRGHDLCFVVPNGPGIKLLEKAGVNHYILPHKPTASSDFNWKNFPFLKKIIHEYKPEILHTFIKGIPQLALLQQDNVKLVTTICGGKPHRYFPPISPVTVFSDELHQWLLRQRNPPEAIYTIPGRMKQKQHLPSPEITEFLKAHDIDPKCSPIVLMICRADIAKEKALHSYFQAAKLFAQENDNGVFIHIGSGNDAFYATRIRETATEINKETGRRILISTEYGSASPAKFFQLADIGVGMGRSAFESMALGKPTLILSNEGFGGVVSPQSIDKIASYNFTARHPETSTPAHSSIARDLCSAINALHQDRTTLKEVSIFAQNYYNTKLNVETAVDTYEQLYKETALNIFRPLNKLIITRLIITEIARTIWYALKNKTKIN